jgi:hypothetical protein
VESHTTNFGTINVGGSQAASRTAPHQLSGIVKNKGGQGLAGQSVKLLNAHTNETVSETTTDHSGKYTLHCEEGSYLVSTGAQRTAVSVPRHTSGARADR